MPDAIWIDKPDELPALARTLESQTFIGVDTEFLRERTFFPKLCLLQLAAGGDIWCVDTLRGSLEPLVPALTAPQTQKVIHAARQDLEAFYLTTKRVITPLFDTQIAAGCIGLKPQVGYAELVKSLLHVTIPKGQTRTDWSRRPLSREQLDYAADDVLYLGDIARHLSARLRELGREHWVTEDCAALEDPALYEPAPAQAWERLKGIGQLDPKPRARAKTLAMWRERLARERDLPRSWIISDVALFAVAQTNQLPEHFNEGFAASLLRTLKDDSETPLTDLEPSREARPTAEQKALAERLGRVVDARAADLKVSPELLAPRSELKGLAMGRRDVHALNGWRRAEIGERLIEALS
jgi:ribonuclease D